jgi:hypothetical protein
MAAQKEKSPDTLSGLFSEILSDIRYWCVAKWLVAFLRAEEATPQ